MANFNDDDSELVRLALLVKDKAYNPYSNFRVGACVQTSTGKMFTGKNDLQYLICIKSCSLLKLAFMGITIT